MSEPGLGEEPVDAWSGPILRIQSLCSLSEKPHGVVDGCSIRVQAREEACPCGRRSPVGDVGVQQ